MITLQDIHKTYLLGDETVYALHNVSLEISEGEFVAIVGQSGSGKSTLMNVVGCLDRPTSGVYQFGGDEISKLNDHQIATIRNTKIGFVFQNFNLLPSLTAAENVELPLIYQGMSAKKRRRLAEKALHSVGLGDRLSHRPSQLSGGQQQRVAIARALAAKPPLILADEPTGALDSKTGRDILQILQKLNQEGHTIVLITHDQEIAKEAKRVIRLQDGKLVEDRRWAG
ncbi:ABC transporter ATP-binding protein [Paenactinomyces guangxiensis]|uniref:ABC transporter ATP-binding protein n=1 Tax=Paenactinomyces guangxiensis TaxID=1490290 RepID=A0A7W1WPV5_9BACL|nr:ABC transporter ATP-binding protein [Paenactinomyces guangxiensis]MBH8591336.1 ABC transporter ATP-binding protein [Paenactinomyces guangxiensis]